MDKRAGYLWIAVSLTVLEGFVDMHYGWPVWRVWSGDIWGCGLLLMMEPMAATSLANLWLQAVPRATGALGSEGALQGLEPASVLIEPRGESNV